MFNMGEVLDSIRDYVNEQLGRAGLTEQDLQDILREFDTHSGFADATRALRWASAPRDYALETAVEVLKDRGYDVSSFKAKKTEPSLSLQEAFWVVKGYVMLQAATPFAASVLS